MRVLIVEDNAFNAFCLSRLLLTVDKQIQVLLAKDSLSALSYVTGNKPSLVILDGDLGASDGLRCNGPALADMIWQANPNLPVVAWSNSDSMRSAFIEVFRQYNKPFNECSYWPKIVSQERVQQSLSSLVSWRANERFSNEQNGSRDVLPLQDCSFR
ncbi:MULTISPECIES: response regulator [unclassified Legionella]|uniref:response regulator n=1 Tax=unclassified Legionella TaxID=2622702 RepID=UPI001055569B|nr:MULTISPECIES: response regulator [unclassified Legionella]MDI9819005.1 response regulator [Legionella sp. PL877]